MDNYSVKTATIILEDSAGNTTEYIVDRPGWTDVVTEYERDHEHLDHIHARYFTPEVSIRFEFSGLDKVEIKRHEPSLEEIIARDAKAKEDEEIRRKADEVERYKVQADLILKSLFGREVEHEHIKNNFFRMTLGDRSVAFAVGREEQDFTTWNGEPVYHYYLFTNGKRVERPADFR